MSFLLNNFSYFLFFSNFSNITQQDLVIYFFADVIIQTRIVIILVKLSLLTFVLSLPFNLIVVTVFIEFCYYYKWLLAISFYRKRKLVMYNIY